MTMMHEYPLAAQTMAKPMPVLPEVYSMTVVFPEEISPDFSASSIIFFAIRSLTDPPGFCTAFTDQITIQIKTSGNSKLLNYRDESKTEKQIGT
jgi:hypothetical protein